MEKPTKPTLPEDAYIKSGTRFIDVLVYMLIVVISTIIISLIIC